MVKRLIVCCDGTWDTADQLDHGRVRATNVIRTALSIAPTDPDGVAQRVYYHPGVGTSRWRHLVGGAFGLGLSANVQDAYRFVVDNFEEGDDLYFFGFSRGAFTARSVAGLVRKCGVLRRENADRLEEAYRLYRSWATKPRGMASTTFRNAFSCEPRIRFIGVWDTVGALGIPPFGPPALHGLVTRAQRRWSFHDTTLSSRVGAAFQALAIDEHRAAFKPTLWQQQPGASAGQVLEQVWFAGAHSDVGGGLASTSLSDIALLWMVAKAQEHGLHFRPDALSRRTGGDDDGDPDVTADFTVAPRADTLPHASRRGIFALTPGWDRPIGLPGGDDGGPGQRVASTAVQLLDDRPDSYRSPMLQQYLARPGHPPAVPVPLTFEPGPPAGR